MAVPDHEFLAPPWEEPLDVDRALRDIPENARLAGTFFVALVEGAKRRGVVLPLSRDSYETRQLYPVTEFAPVLVAAAHLFYPDQSLRQALRSLGKSVARIFAISELGQAMLRTSASVHGAVHAIAKTYAVNLQPSRCRILEMHDDHMLVNLARVPYFLDSHHVGVFEGTLEYAGVNGRVRIRRQSDAEADLLLEWDPPTR